MIQQKVGDLLEIEFEGSFYYLVVLTQIVMFGGNIVFAYHTDGDQRDVSALLAISGGFNVCTDLIQPKREGKVTRVHVFEDVTGFWRSRYAKGTNEYRPGVKADEWFIYRID